MASAISTPTSSLWSSASSSSTSPQSSSRLALCTLSNYSISVSRSSRIQLHKWAPHLGITPFSSWEGLKQSGISSPLISIKIERRRKCKGKGVYASLFGVGAPEALVIGVVALLVFGPKGLAEVARNLGKTLREFQPTIKELQEVSREFKSTLEREIGLDDIKDLNQSTFRSDKATATASPSPSASSEDSLIKTDPNGSPSPSVESIDDKLKAVEEQSTETVSSVENQPESQTKTEDDSSSPRAYSSEEYLKITEEQLKAAGAQEKSETTYPDEIQSEPQNQSDSLQEAASVSPLPQKPESET
nr:sec-independent protein translocase protein TATB, chloroplastic [Ipomoea batatas]